MNGFECKTVAGTVDGRFDFPGVAAITERLENLGDTDGTEMDGFTFGEGDVRGAVSARAFGAKRAAVGVGCVITTGGGVIICVFVCLTFVARAMFWPFRMFVFCIICVICVGLLMVTGGATAPAANVFAQLKQLIKTTFGLSKSSSCLMTTMRFTCVCSSSSCTTFTTIFWTTMSREWIEARV